MMTYIYEPAVYYAQMQQSIQQYNKSWVKILKKIITFDSLLILTLSNTWQYWQNNWIEQKNIVLSFHGHRGHVSAKGAKWENRG